MRTCLTLLFCLSILGSMAQWGPPTTVARSEMAGPGALWTGDLDGDGDHDVLVSSYITQSEDQILAFLNQGAWQFSASQSVLVPDMFNFVFHEMIDVDGDGLEDIIGYPTTSPHWRKNLGNLQFGEPQIIAEASAYQFCDLDGQNGLDLILVDPNGSSGYYYAHQLPGGGFTAPMQIAEFALGPFLDPADIKFLLIDLNGDGVDDLLYNASSPELLQVATGTAQGGFDPPQPYYSDPTGLVIRRLTEFDRDPSNGNIGFRVDFDGSNQSIWFEPTTGLEYTTSITVTPWSYETDLIYGKAIDLNADGAQDLWTRHNEYFASIRLNDGNGSFSDLDTVSTAYYSSADKLVDMDNDGDQDIVLRQNHADRVAILENTGSGSLNIRHEVTAGSLPSPEKVELVDIDADGDVDVLSCNYGGIRVLYNNGSGTFGNATVVDEETPKFDLMHTDIDQDGDIDILSIGYYLGVKLFLQGPIGVFTTVVLEDWLGPFVPGATTDFPRLVRTMDIDLDGDLDVVVGESVQFTFEPSAFLFENLGGGSFAPSVGLGPEWLFLAECLMVDMNDDGALDRLADIDGTIGVYLNTGGSFGDPLLFNGTFGKPILLIDLNGDGLEDMIANAEGDLVLWHATAPYQFVLTQALTLSYDPRASTLQDVNGDERVDLVYLNGQQVLMRQCGPDGLFGQASVIWDFEDSGEPLTNEDRCIGVAEITGDGLVDILITDRFNGRAELFANLSNSDYQISGRIFLDLNGDQVYQPEEPPLPWVNLQVDPDASSPFTNENGDYTVYATPGAYTLQPALDPELWTVTSTSPLQATLDAGAPVAAGLDFAIVPAQDISLVTASMVQGNVPCGATTFLSLNIANAGTRIEQGTLTLQLAQYASFQSSVPAPTSVVGNTITWTFEGLNIQEVRSIVALVTTPTLGSIGSQWNHVLQVVTVDDGGGVLWTTYATLGGEVTCAYDPNDKQVYPAGYGEAGAIGMDTPYLDYTVRFQNTGTAPAFDVVIMDQLDADLDPERVEVLGFSHTPTQVAITANGSIQFKFLDIMLPDSASDQLGSQGFIHFRIHLREGLPHLTEIPNTAAIYFDLNPPIITNTVHSTLVDCITWQPELEADGYGVLRAPAGDLYQWFLNGEPIPGAVADSIQITTNGSYTVEVTSTLGCVATTPAIIATDLPETMAESGFLVVPNPFTQHARLIADEILPNGTTVTLIDRLGRVLNTLNASGTRTIDIHRGEAPPGLYLLRLDRPGRATVTQRVVIQ